MTDDFTKKIKAASAFLKAADEEFPELEIRHQFDGRNFDDIGLDQYDRLRITLISADAKPEDAQKIVDRAKECGVEIGEIARGYIPFIRTKDSPPILYTHEA